MPPAQRNVTLPSKEPGTDLKLERVKVSKLTACIEFNVLELISRPMLGAGEVTGREPEQSLTRDSEESRHHSESESDSWANSVVGGRPAGGAPAVK